MKRSAKNQTILDKLRGGLIVSCQAHEPDGLYGVDRMTDMAIAAEMGGASGIRADDPNHIKSIRAAVKLPIVGIYKEDVEGYETRITLNMDRAREIYDAGADIIAFDATDRPHPYSTTGYELIKKAKLEWDVIVMADCSTIEEARLAYDAGADILSSTMSGYTSYSEKQSTPDFKMVKQMKKEFPDAFIISEGRVNSPEYARRLIRNGADAVCVGSNITRPIYSTQRYLNKMRMYPEGGPVLVFDIGGTKILCGVMTAKGELSKIVSVPTPQTNAEDIYKSLVEIGEKVIVENKDKNIKCIGISTGGTIDHCGNIIYATDTLPGWKNFPLRKNVQKYFNMPTFVLNDGNAAALGEAIYGKHKNCQSILGITVGTGFGAGLIVDGSIHYGTLDYAINMGAIIAQRNGKVSDKVEGALEAYVSGRCIYEQYKIIQPNTKLTTGIEVGDLALNGDEDAIKAVTNVAEWLGIGIATIVACHNPEIVIIGGGVVELGDLFIKTTKRTFKTCAFPALKDTPIEVATFKSNGNLYGAAAFALDNMH